MARTAAAALALAAILILAGCGADPAFTSGKVYMQQEDLENAIEQFQIAIRNNETDFRAHMWLGEAYAQTGELELAHDEFFTALELAAVASDTAEVEEMIAYRRQQYELEGQLLNSAGTPSSFEEAIVQFENALVIDPRSSSSYANIGFAHHNLQNYEEAIAAFETALELEPENETIRLNLLDSYNAKAGTLVALGDSESALLFFEKIEVIDPGSENINFDIAEVHYSLRDYREAIRSYEKQLTLFPDDPDKEHMLYRIFLSYYAIGKDLEEAGQMDLALPEFESALPALDELVELDYENLGYHRGLARIYNKLGRTEEAMIELAIVQELLGGAGSTE